MHEVSIVMSIMDIAENECRNAGCTVIQSIAVDIGAASSVMPDALSMAFDIIKIDTIASEAALLINNIPLGGICNACAKRFTTDEQFILACPNCNDKDFVLDRGRELNVTEIEVD